MLLVGGVSQYRVIAPLAHTASCRIYICEDVGTGELRLLQVAATPEANGGLSRGTYILHVLSAASRRLDTIYGQKHDGKRLHYDRLFPKLIESFVSADQEGRRVTILAFTDVSDVSALVPLSNLRTRDKVRLDCKTSAWVMGRLLKLLTFVHSEGIEVRALSSDNILLDRDQHFAIVLNWANARMYQERVSQEGATSDIVAAASAVMASIGGTSHGVSYELDESESRYVDLIGCLADGEESSADHAHTRFYNLVRDIWPNEFHPFTALPL